MSDDLIGEKVVDNSIEGDFLNRQNFIQQVKRIIELLSANKKNSCFAISGTWGIGKSYVLEKLEKQLLIEQNEETALDKYFVFHFNCWEYDYYEEPLIAIISSMLNDINTKERFFTVNAREHISSAVKFVLSRLYDGGSKWLESQIGINPKNITDGLAEIHADAIAKVENINKYDEYLDFKQVLSTLRKELKEITSERTVLFIVDELDRCIPEYQIKVLERLHHIFDGIENMQVILAVDKNQLERTIKKMFGDSVDSQKYLAKYIKFEIELNEGTYSHKFEEILGYYFEQFDEVDDLVIEFEKNIFKGIAIRERIAIVEKCHLLHNLINNNNGKMPAYYMCVELFLAIIVHEKVIYTHKRQGIVFAELFGDNPTEGLQFLQSKMSRDNNQRYDANEKCYYLHTNGKNYIKTKDLWGMLLGCYSIITECKIDGFFDNKYDRVFDYTKKFWILLKTIK